MNEEKSWDEKYPPGVTVHKKKSAEPEKPAPLVDAKITPKERVLLDGFRLLTERQKSRVLAMIDKLIDGRVDLD